MIPKEYPMFEILQSKSPKEMTEKLNELMQKVCKKNPEVQTAFDSSIGHYAHVRWLEQVTIPEDVRDEFKLQGIQYCCGECPFFILQKDRRIKYSVCNKGEKVRFDDAACVDLYRMIKEGEVEL